MISETYDFRFRNGNYLEIFAIEDKEHGILKMVGYVCPMFRGPKPIWDRKIGGRRCAPPKG